MHAKIKYEKYEYGMATSSTEYKCSVETGGGATQINFEFNSPQDGLSEQKGKVKSVHLVLDHREAELLASSIIAQLHHPMIRGRKSVWSPPNGMQTLDRAEWEEKLQIDMSRVPRQIASIKVVNGTAFHIGEIKFAVWCCDKKTGEMEPKPIEHSVVVDLLPGTTGHVVVKLQELTNCFEGYKIAKVVPIDVTGLRIE